jgi:predicted kinase
VCFAPFQPDHYGVVPLKCVLLLVILEAGLTKQQKRTFLHTKAASRGANLTAFALDTAALRVACKLAESTPGIC